MFGRHHTHGCDAQRFARDEFGPRFGRHGRWGRGGPGGRVFDHGDLRYLLLQLIAEKPRHGYELIKAIEEKFGGAYSPSPGVIYPTLTLLEDLGYVRPEAGDGTRKQYSITEEGTAFLAANRAVVDAILGRVEQATRAFGGGPAPEILRAAQNLRTALMIRLRRGPLEPAQIRHITELLDRAAGEIERS